MTPPPKKVSQIKVASFWGWGHGVFMKCVYDFIDLPSVL